MRNCTSVNSKIPGSLVSLASGLTGEIMSGFWGKMKGGQNPAVSADFRHALMQQVMRTELIRIKALIATVSLLAIILWTVYFLAPEAVSRVWHGNLKPAHLYSIIVPFVLFELWVHAIISRHLRLDRDIPVIRRYVGALIETSMPTFALALHINSMGEVAALGFVTPLTYFIFIILSTLRLDFWLSTFTGLVAAVELFCMAMFYHRAGSIDPEPSVYYHAGRSLILLICGALAGAVAVQLRRQFEASIAAATARDRVTNLFGQHVSPQVVERLIAEGASTSSDIRSVAVMFVDFRGFTAGARQRSPQEVSIVSTARSGCWSKSSTATAASSTSFWATDSWRCLGRRSKPPTPRTTLSMRRAKCWLRWDASTRPMTGRCGSASAFISAKWSPAISARPGARNTP